MKYIYVLYHEPTCTNLFFDKDPRKLGISKLIDILDKAGCYHQGIYDKFTIWFIGDNDEKVRFVGGNNEKINELEKLEKYPKKCLRAVKNWAETQSLKKLLECEEIEIIKQKIIEV